MKNKEIADIFAKFADVLEFKGDMPFKINAYRRASRTIGELTEDIDRVWQEGRLGDIPGVGKGLQQKIEDYLSTGKIAQFEEALKTAPADLFKLLSIQSFGPKTAALAYKNLGVQTLEDLRIVLDNGELAKLPGMGAKKVENIRKGLALLTQAQDRPSIGVAWPVVNSIIAYLREKVGEKIGAVSPAGSVRRYRETVHDIDILVETDKGPEVIDEFSRFPHVTRILGAGDTKGSILIEDRFQVDLRAVPGDSYGAALQYFTGSKAHNVRLREIAKKQGYKINEYGIFAGDDKVGGQDERDIYERLGMAWIPPELREDRGEIEAAMENRVPDLVESKDIKADLHIHSVYSDGQLTVAEMADEMRKRGYRYMAFCDHSKAAMYANGMDEDRLLRQVEEIRKLNETFSEFLILAGCEVDILPNGSLDFEDRILAQLDFVVASIHSAFKTDPTGRTLNAIDNPYVDVIGHPTGRLISRRQGFEIDVNRIVERAAQTGTALEVNAYWDRLDLSDLNVKLAVENCARISINTDSHDTTHLPMMVFGIGTARRGWATKKDVINTMDIVELQKWQKRRR